MIEPIKKMIWDVLKQKEVSLAMIYDQEGEILWHRGREIHGRTVHEGQGFSKSLIKKSLAAPQLVEAEDVLIRFSDQPLPESAKTLRIRGLHIQSLAGGIFLYIDSGTKDTFSQTDRELFKVLGNMLGSMIDQIRSRESQTWGICGVSKAIQEIRRLALKYSIEEQPVLILGETGVGKSYIARLIHDYSGRKGKFVTVHIPSVPETLFESEVFGHRKGAFTDAKSDKIGSVTEAEGGTLFFDEISEVPTSLQAKLLRFIESRKFSVLGGDGEGEADVRIIVATNSDLTAAIKKKEFREDLYYRLQVLEITIPPLRLRREDIPPLILEYASLLRGKELGKGFWEAVNTYDWPGNVRELVTVLTRAGILLAGPITGEDIKDIIHYRDAYKTTGGSGSRPEHLWLKIQSGGSFWDEVWQPFIERELDRGTVQSLLAKVYDDSRNSFKRMIQSLNVPEKEYHLFMSLMHKYRIDPRSSPGG